MKDTYSIHAYDLVTFVQEIEKAVKLGYEVDLHGIDNYPRMIGYQFLMTLLKSSTEQEVVKPETPVVASIATPETEAAKEVKAEAQAEPAKRGPKGKGK